MRSAKGCKYDDSAIVRFIEFYIHFKRELNPLFVASKPSNFSDYLGNNQITHIRISQR